MPSYGCCAATTTLLTQGCDSALLQCRVPEPGGYSRSAHPGGEVATVPPADGGARADRSGTPRRRRTPPPSATAALAHPHTSEPRSRRDPLSEDRDLKLPSGRKATRSTTV